MARLEKFYNEKVKDEMMKKFSYKTSLSVPRLEKIIMNMEKKEKNIEAYNCNDLHRIFSEEYYQKHGKDYVSSRFIGYEMKLCLLYTSPSPRDATLSRMPSSA